MKHKVATLEGVLLDAAVAKAEGADYQRLVDHCQLAAGVKWSPSTDWQYGGPLIDPIIKRRRIDLSPTHKGWIARANHSLRQADYDPNLGSEIGYGETALIAAMRSLVASKFGEEVDLP